MSGRTRTSTGSSRSIWMRDEGRPCTCQAPAAHLGEAFRAINPDYIIPMHCTGMNTIIAVHRVMPQKLVMPPTGTRVIFGV